MNLDAAEATGGVLGTKTLAWADDLALGLIESSIHIPDGGSWADRWSIELLGVVQMCDGKVVRQVQWSVDDLTVALARFDELVADRPWNAAAQAHRDHCQAFYIEGDIDSFEQAFALDMVMDDRRRHAQVRVEGLADNLELWRVAAGAFEAFDYECLEVRGDRLAMVWLRLSASRPVANEQEAVAVIEVAEDGKIRCAVMFEPEQLDEARAVLDELAAEATSRRAPTD